jgi:hypothetical protein
MGLRLSAQARREVIQRLAPQYQQASASSKGALLDEVVATTGYARRSAMRLLNHPPQGARPHKRKRQAKYGPEVQQVLFLLWHQANRMCIKRLIPFLPFVPSCKRTGESSSGESGRFPSCPKRSSLSHGGSGELSKEGELLGLVEQATDLPEALVERGFPLALGPASDFLLTADDPHRW